MKLFILKISNTIGWYLAKSLNLASVTVVSHGGSLLYSFQQIKVYVKIELAIRTLHKKADRGATYMEIQHCGVRVVCDSPEHLVP